MTTNGLEPPACDPEVYRKGEGCFCDTHYFAECNRGRVKQIALLAGQKVDWCFVGGRAFVCALGDIEKVTAGIEQLMPEHARLFARARERFLG